MRVFTFVVALLAGAGAAAAADHGHHDRHHDTPPAAEARVGQSIYQLAGRFVDQAGTPVGIDVARGHPVIISMIYASCPDACPRLIADIRRIEAAVPAGIREDLRVVVVSFDPERDTPTVLRSLGAAHGVGARWHFLTGSDDGAREVAAVLGVKYRRLSTGAINHSSVITLLDRAGVIDSRLEGIAQPIDALVARVVAVSGIPRAGR